MLRGERQRAEPHSAPSIAALMTLPLASAMPACRTLCIACMPARERADFGGIGAPVAHVRFFLDRVIR